MTVKNTGARAGSDVVQIYLRDFAASVTRPVKELKAFERVNLEPGQTKVLHFEIPHSSLGFYDRSNNFVVEPGMFSVVAGFHSAEGLESTFEVR